MKHFFFFLVLTIFLFSQSTFSKGNTTKHDVAISSDSETIAYSVYGSGETTLLFVHGWSADSRYWHNQIRKFSKKNKVITVDLAGHGNSSSNRQDYTTQAFADDISAVIEQEASDNIILVGHSLGGSIVASVAKNNPEKTLGIIGVDTFHNVSAKMPLKNANAAIKPFTENYAKTMEKFVGSLFSSETKTELKNWISLDMRAAAKPVAISTLNQFMLQSTTDEPALVFKSIDVPVISINATLRPTDKEGNENTIKHYQLVYIEGTGHFPMLEKPREFNSLLRKAIHDIHDFKP